MLPYNIKYAFALFKKSNFLFTNKPTVHPFGLNIGNNTITPEMQIKIRNEISMRMDIDISRIGSLVIVYNETTGTTQVQFTITSVLQSENDVIGTSMTVVTLNSIVSIVSNNTLIPQNVQVSTMETRSCDAGFFRRQTLDESICIACLAGTFKEISSKNDCDSCVQGKYSTTLGASSETSCISCAPGKYSDIKGATSIMDCFECEAGKFSNVVSAQSNSTCEDCVFGKYSDTEGASVFSTCQDCIAGKYSDIEGATSVLDCLECEAGKFSNIVSAQTCQDCVAGKYSSTVGAIAISTCQDCVAGKYSFTRAAASYAYCLLCPIGKISTISGASSSLSCLSCARGRFIQNLQNVLNQCQLCPQGSWSSDLNRVGSCHSCLPGKYGNEVGAVRERQCVKCPFSTFNPNSSSIDIDQCQVCPNNVKTVIGGLVSEEECMMYDSARNYNPNSIPSILYGCNAGYYLLADFCIACPAGTYSARQTRGSIETCIKCGQGKFNPHEGVSSANGCQMCPNGKYHNFRGMIDDTNCRECMCL